jgi:hypothetical protein
VREEWEKGEGRCCQPHPRKMGGLKVELRGPAWEPDRQLRAQRKG